MTAPARNPFHHPDNPVLSTPGDQSTVAGLVGQAGQAGRVEQVERVDKPWGYEEIFAVLEGRYVGKILNIVSGAVLSLQRHRSKDETIAVQAGRIKVEHGPDRIHLETVVLGPGERLLLRAQVVHRITALEDSRVLEASTARPGWQQDVIRLDDRYGRQGTTSP